MRTILFVCTGNTCRSPMAEAIARHLLEGGKVPGAGAEVFVASAGVAAADGMGISPDAVAALERLGIVHDGTSKSLTTDMVRKASVVLGMTEGHLQEIRRMAGSGEGPRIGLADPAGDVEDPVGMGSAAYDRVARRLLRVLPARLAEVLAP